MEIECLREPGETEAPKDPKEALHEFVDQEGEAHMVDGFIFDAKQIEAILEDHGEILSVTKVSKSSNGKGYVSQPYTFIPNNYG